MLNGTILPTKIGYSQSDSGVPVECIPCNFAELLVVLSPCFHTSFTFSNLSSAWVTLSPAHCSVFRQAGPSP